MLANAIETEECLASAGRQRKVMSSVCLGYSFCALCLLSDFEYDSAPDCTLMMTVQRPFFLVHVRVLLRWAFEYNRFRYARVLASGCQRYAGITDRKQTHTRAFVCVYFRSHHPRRCGEEMSCILCLIISVYVLF